jgi:pimeloyl-ACP methyl ester carboxylesterase
MKAARQFLRWTVAAVGCLAMLALGGFAYERIAAAMAEEGYPAEGQMVAVNGHRLHALAMGTSGPSVVFEAGLDAGGHLSWLPVQRRLAGQARTLSYDRAGILWSERGNHPKTCRAIAAELSALLRALEVEKPYYLVGHSFAALTLRCFVAMQPGDVAGIVLVEPSHPGLAERLPPAAVEAIRPPARWKLEFAGALGIQRLFYGLRYPGTDRESAINRQLAGLGGRSLDSVFAEMSSVEAIAEAASREASFGDIPLIVITGTAANRSEGVWPTEELREQVDALWSALQVETLELSSDSWQVLADRSGHYVQLEQPGLVASAITDILDPGSRSRRPNGAYQDSIGQ